MTKFKPGQSGNPAGRPPKDPQKIFQRTLRPHVPQLVETVLADALSGNPQSAAALLNFYGQAAR